MNLSLFFKEGYCHFKNVSIGVRVESYMNIGKENATELKQAIAQYGPISVLINTQPKSFKFYSSGTYYDPECSGKLTFFIEFPLDNFHLLLNRVRRQQNLDIYPYLNMAVRARQLASVLL